MEYLLTLKKKVPSRNTPSSASILKIKYLYNIFITDLLSYRYGYGVSAGDLWGKLGPN